MSQKIWVIEDLHEKPVSSTPETGESNPSSEQKNIKLKNPALSYSLSLLVWGCGQFYNGQRKAGLMLLLFMINFYLLMWNNIFYFKYIQSAFESFSINRSIILIVDCVLYISGLIVWIVNAWQAYFKAIMINTASFKGNKMRLLPAICSFMIPGWGQLLNGQIKKGIFFQTFAMAGLAAFPFIIVMFQFWSSLKSSQAKLFLEWALAICTILSPIILFTWFCSIFDAAIISMNSIKKEPLRKRMKYALKKFRHNIQVYGWENTLRFIIKRNVSVIVLLIFCLFSCNYFPGGYYMQKLQSLEDKMLQQEMTVMPDLINNILAHRQY